jgi:ADP-ribosylation factor related protein 1
VGFGVRSKLCSSCSGRKELQSIWTDYFPDCHGILYVIDGSDESRFQESKDVFYKVLQQSELHEVPVLILLNKSDQSQTKQTILETFELEKIQNHDWFIQCISAESGSGLTQALEVLIQYLQKNGRYVDTNAYI